jgi:hypothetical protein
MKKVFLIWDIWDWKWWYYHIWDELMFFYNYKILKKYWYKIFVSSRSSQTRYKNVVLDIDFSGTFRFVKLITILLLYKLYPNHSRIKKIINTICSVNSIIFSWWWNLNSIRKWHLYYRFLITYFAKKFKKDVYLSAQTIWPIYWKLDYKILNYILSYCKIIWVRDVNFSINYINDEFKRKVRYFCDDIFIGSKNIKNRKIKSLHDWFNVWISLHSNWDDRNLFEQLLQIKVILESLHWKIKFYRIPHVFDKFWWYDEDFMKSINFIKYENTFKPWLYKSNIENLYKKMDIVITTRYHWGALAIKYWKPAIMIWRDLYELWKFNWLFDSLHIKNCIILSKSDKIDVKNIKSIIIKRSNNITYNESQNFIFNYIKNYDKSRINKNSWTKKH